MTTPAITKPAALGFRMPAEWHQHAATWLTWPQARNVRLHVIPTVDSWIRDYGPNFLVNGEGTTAFNHWGFNAWGGKYETLMTDARVPSLLAPLLDGFRRFEPGLILEGGSIDVNGAGIGLTTEQCLLNE